MRGKNFEREFLGVIVYIATFLSLFSLIVAIFMPFAVRGWYQRYDDYSGLAALGPVGDFIGGTTIAFFNLASIMLLVATLLIQRKELKETQNEYKLTNKTMKKQQFETTLFNMLSLHNQLLNSIVFKKLGMSESQWTRTTWEEKKLIIMLEENILKLLTQIYSTR
jgi:hypothetical protein